MTKAQIKAWNKKLREPFKNLRFYEEGHKYEVLTSPGKPIKSVSSLLKYFYEEFDTETMAENWSKSRKLPIEFVKAAWAGEGDIANTHGSRVHLIGENYVKYKFLGDKRITMIPHYLPIDKQSLGAIQFIEDLPDYLIPVAVELAMFNEELWFCGTCDGILYNTKNGKLIVYDFKTNKTLTGKYGKSPLFKINPERKLTQNNFGKYTLQFSFYQILLEQAGFEVQSRVLVHLQEDEKTKKLYKTYKTQNVTEELLEWLKTGEHLN